MHDYPAVFFTALIIFIFGLFSKLSNRSYITAPILFTCVGVLVSPAGFALFGVDVDTTIIKFLAEVTLIIILFIDASAIHVSNLRDTLSGIPARLLGIGLPLTIILGVAVGYLLYPTISLWLIALVALILSPTDAALGQSVLHSPNIPKQIRESISIESGLNDGIVLPIVLVCLAVLAEGEEVIDGSGRWLSFMLFQLLFGPLTGAAVGWFGGRLVDKTATRDWSEPTFQRLASIALALLAYAFAELLNGNGFIAAFFAGLCLGTKTPRVRKRIQEFGEAEGQLLSLFIFMMLGLVMIPIAAEYWSWRMLLYAILSLTIIRMLPVAISLIGSGLNAFTVAFLGWFGPRGIASILYLLIAAGEIGFEGYEQAMSAIVLTVLLSTVLHGLSAVPLSRGFNKAPR